MATTTWGFEEEAETRPRFRVVDNEDQAENEEPSQAAIRQSWGEVLTRAWFVSKVLLAFAVVAMSITAQTWVNYTQHVERGVPWVLLSILTAIVGPSALSSLMAGHLKLFKRLMMCAALIVCTFFDMSNNSANVLTLNSKQHAVAEASQTGKDTADKRRARLEREIEAADVAADRKPVGELEAAFRIADDKAVASSWVTHTDNHGRQYRVHGAENSQLRRAATLLNGKLTSAREREDKTKELQGVPIETAAPAATDVTVEALKPMFTTMGIEGKDHAEDSRITSWFYGTVFFLVCLFAPWVAQTYLMETLDPAYVRREQIELEKAREVKRAGKMEQKRLRAKAREVREAEKRQRKQDEIEAKRRAKEENEVRRAAPEPRPEPSEPSQWAGLLRTVHDPELDQFCDFGLRPSSGRVNTKDVFNGPWREFCHENGIPYGGTRGEQGALTSRLKTRFKHHPKGGKTWLIGVEIKSQTAKPKLRVVM